MDAVETFAGACDRAGRVVRMLEAALALPQANMPEVATQIEQMRLERAAALAEVAGYAIAHAQEILPELLSPPPPPPSPQENGFVTFTLPHADAPRAANPFLDSLAVPGALSIR